MISKTHITRNGTPQVQSIIITAITLFALSGLMVGFTVGALARTPQSSNNNQNSANLTTHTTPTSKPTPTPNAPISIRLGCPNFSYTNPTTNPDGTFVYNATIQAEDKTGTDANGTCHLALEKPITADGITCRIWLVPAQLENVTTDLSNDKNQLQDPTTFNQPFPHEIQNALLFDPTTPNQVQTCKQGSAQWKFTLSPSVDKGDYFLVGLTDWQGKFWNWSWSKITVSDKNKGN